MGYLKFNGQYIKTDNSYLTAVVFDDLFVNWDGASYVTLSGQPDLSGNKKVSWDMYLDNESGYSSTLFNLGASTDNMSAILDTDTIVVANLNNGTSGAAKTYTIAGLSGKKLECIAVKSANTVDWFQVNGILQDASTSGTLNDDAEVSRIAADGSTGAGDQLHNAYIWDIIAEGAGSWSGVGEGFVSPITSQAWVDSIGNNDGTFSGPAGTIKLTFAGKTFEDWFLPSKNELIAMYNNLHNNGGIGNFANTDYWSSTETGATTASAYSFNTGLANDSASKSNVYRVRVARTFTASIGAYSLGDAGPAGGWIFYVDGGTYYEAAPVDQAGDQLAVWSNVTNGTSGATNEAIGDGDLNTGAILVQTGHLYSSALLADKYWV